METISHIHEASATAAHRQLIAALGTENNAAQWMVFMEAVEAHLPLMASAGRPTKEEISHSVIGRLGFSSWRAMIEAPVHEHGLNWSYNSWKAWLKAWSVVSAFPYLRKEPLTASAILKLKKTFEVLPETKEKLIEAQQTLVKSEQEKRENTHKALQEEISLQASELAEVRIKYEALVASYQEEKARVASLEREIGALSNGLLAAEQKAEETYTQLTKMIVEEKAKQTVSRWQHLKCFLIGNN